MFSFREQAHNTEIDWETAETAETTDKKAVLSQRWPRDARYKSGWIEWVVAEI